MIIDEMHLVKKIKSKLNIQGDVISTNFLVYYLLIWIYWFENCLKKFEPCKFVINFPKIEN